MLIRSHNQRGFSLIELMISLAVGLLVIAGVTSVFSKTVATNTSTMQATRLNQEMRAIMDIISSDLRRAGYYRDSFCTTDSALLSTAAIQDTNYCADANTTNTGSNQPNPFDTIEIGTSKSGNDCILFSYDYTDDVGTRIPTLNPNGVLDETTDNNENYGYKRDVANNGNGIISRRAGGALCNAGGWDRLSDPTLSNITSLDFDSTGTRTIAVTGGVLMIREITITMSGQLASDANVSLTLQNTVRVLNDRFCFGANCTTGI